MAAHPFKAGKGGADDRHGETDPVPSLVDQLLMLRVLPLVFPDIVPLIPLRSSVREEVPRAEQTARIPK